MNATLHCADFEVRFEDLYHCGRCLTFPCNAQGHVDIDGLSERARVNYLYARAMVGRDYSTPSVLGHALAAQCSQASSYERCCLGADSAMLIHPTAGKPVPQQS